MRRLDVAVGEQALDEGVDRAGVDEEDEDTPRALRRVRDLDVVDVERRQGGELVAQVDEVSGEVRVEVVEAVEVVR